MFSFHNGTNNKIIMTDKNPRPPNSLDSNFTNQPLELPEYFKFDDDQWPDDEPEPFVFEHVVNQENQQANKFVGDFGGSGSYLEGSSSNDVSSEREKKEVTDKVAFKTQSEVEILDDGFKWRKYGKKMVKNSPNPRNYYRCSVDGCQVKKRVERDVNDPSYVITTYDLLRGFLKFAA
ncbi:probable WRKY transcription factor 51 isoform X2 [Cicer arietinum]|uniref:Probable WRKY transcription factor 50 isoform X2 n=1 Tax=Cicer arietinum TaxID=3827 RepID=A0A3Q7YFG5_CICAR|nr:probable WRKY transcription factor 50 isoform X2 [Cicer arietinum]